jgi:hypothetical protein
VDYESKSWYEEGGGGLLISIAVCWVGRWEEGAADVQQKKNMIGVDALAAVLQPPTRQPNVRTGRQTDSGAYLA